MQAVKRFSKEAITKLKGEIKQAEGNEVFALGYINENDNSKLVVRLEVCARGNKGKVLALHDISAGDFPQPDVLIHNHPSGFLTPSDNDLLISSRAAEQGIGSYIVDNHVEKVYVVAEPVKKRTVAALDPDAVSAALEPGGAISKRLPAYEIRESQLQMMQLIIQGFNKNALVAAEAGTGVGKSFAYLLPALSYAEANNERIVISTATITLQEQLFRKDIPLVTAGLNKKIKTVLIKGRGNYLCLRRLADAMNEPLLDTEEQTQIKDIAAWADTSEIGSRSDLAFMPVEGLWSRVCSEADNCMSMHCTERERCFVMQLRREAADAKILVVNHHLLFADLAARRSGAGYDAAVVLPPYSRVIIDEAHTIEDAATSFFSREFSRLGVFRLLGRLYRKRRIMKYGLLVRLLSLLPDFPDEKKSGKNSIETMFEKIRSSIDSLDKAALGLCGNAGVFRLTPHKDIIVRDLLFPAFAMLRKQLNSLAAFVRELLEQVPAKDAEDPAVWELRSVLRRLDTIASICSSFIEYRENSNDVAWIEKRSASASKDEPWAVFNITPIDIAPSLKEALFEPSKTVVCVSATLTTGVSEKTAFEYWKKRSGLCLVGERETLYGIFPSPFPYQSKVLLAAPGDAPLPTEQGYSDFVDTAVTALTEISGGSALVLFTSYQALKSAYEAARPTLEKLGIRVLKQGDDDRNRLLAGFLDDKNSVLFATDSFWEGVDAPGDTLRLVILCRLPFRIPNDPVFEARCEALESRGGNAFMDLSLPEAVMKFKQGFGRLMRRSSDYGSVVVLDGRLLKKQYGAVFLRSLPETKTCFGSLEKIIRTLEDFLF